MEKTGEEADLCLVGEEGGEVVEVQGSTRELVEHELPHPFKGSGICDIGPIGSLARSASEQANKLATGRDDERSRVALFGEGAGLVFVRQNGQLERFHITGGIVLAYEGCEPGQCANGSVGGGSALDNAANAISLEVQVGVVKPVGSEHAAEGKYTIVGVREFGCDVSAIAYQVLELRRRALGTLKVGYSDHDTQ